jgi:signal transduction histidine kinase
MNLLSNKNSPISEKYAWISMLLSPLDKKWGNHKIFCKDTGIGIKVDNNENIQFCSEDNSTNRKFGGMGLGLSISNQLLALMDSNYSSSANMVTEVILQK